ncbi:MAG TPA: cupin domain-containing protein [Actinomycetaceae bacterium]|nr:cupin domain-containing protein [Actinomycetaceae bacterium]
MATTPVNTSHAITNLLADLPITKAATTSRVVVNNDVLRHVVFAFDTGQLLTEHTSPRAVIVSILTGRMDFTVKGETTTLDAGDVLYLAPGDPHALVALEPCHMALTMVDVNETAHAVNKSS